MSKLSEAEYKEIASKHLELGENLKLSIQALLRQNGIDFHDVQMRVKSYESADEKMGRKGYGDTELLEDICGLRVICYYLEDIEKIRNIISSEFEIINSSDKEKEVEPDQFWYRSYHYVIKLNSSWLQIPNYRNCASLKAEIQIRTILMHAWADIEHKLTYKKIEAVPVDLKRPFAQLSAVLTLADERFNELKKEKKEYISKIDKPVFDLNLPVDIDTLQAYLGHYFKDRKEPSSEVLTSILSRIQRGKIKFKDIEAARTKLIGKLPEMEAIIHENGYAPQKKFGQTGALMLLLDLTNQDFFDERKKGFDNGLLELLTSLRSKVST